MGIPKIIKGKTVDQDSTLASILFSFLRDSRLQWNFLLLLDHILSNFEKLKSVFVDRGSFSSHSVCFLLPTVTFSIFRQYFHERGISVISILDSGRMSLNLKSTATRPGQNCWLLAWSLQCVSDASLLTADPAWAGGAPAHFAPTLRLRPAGSWAQPQGTECRGCKQPRTLPHWRRGRCRGTNL